MTAPITAPSTEYQSVNCPPPEPPLVAASRNSKGARTLISGPFKVNVERRYVTTCGTCRAPVSPANVGTMMAKELYDGTDRDEAIRLGKEHADEHRQYAAKLAASPLPDAGPSEGE